MQINKNVPYVFLEIHFFQYSDLANIVVEQLHGCCDQLKTQQLTPWHVNLTWNKNEQNVSGINKQSKIEKELFSRKFKSYNVLKYLKNKNVKRVSLIFARAKSESYLVWINAEETFLVFYLVMCKYWPYPTIRWASFGGEGEGKQEY